MVDPDNSETKRKDPEPPQFVAKPEDLKASKFVTKPEDLKAFRDSVADAASVSGTLWITYLGVLFYLVISVGSVTHKDLFLQGSLTLPFMNINLPTAGFFLLAPLLFLILHAYVLLHFVILTDKIAVLDQALATQIGDQEVLRWQLPANIFVQLLAGPSEVRDGITGVFLWLIALVTLVISPVSFCCCSSSCNSYRIMASSLPGCSASRLGLISGCYGCFGHASRYENWR